MELGTISKRLQTHLTPKGKLIGLPDELYLAVLGAWQEWPGTSKEFYTAIGFSRMQLAGLLGKAKRLVREGAVVTKSDFFEVKDKVLGPGTDSPCGDIEVSWSEGRVIRFRQVEHLLEFLKKAA